MKSFIKHALRLIAFAAFAFSASAVSAQATKKADAAFNKGEYPKAIHMYKKILTSDKISAATKSEIYTKMAKCYLKLNYYRPARQWFEEVMSVNPGYTYNYPSYAEALRCNGNYTEALVFYYRYITETDDTIKQREMQSVLRYSIENDFQNPFVDVASQYAINTFGKKRGLQFLDDKLYYSTTGYMLDPSASDYDDHINDYHVFRSDLSGNALTNSLPESEIPIFVRNKVLSFAVYPETKDVYFVALNRKGEPALYISQFIDSVYSQKKEVKIGGKSLPVESITFTPDGRKMIFSAYLENEGRVGNNDLWISNLVGEDWQAPVNMGSKINTRGDEITPFINGNTLFFSSNGQTENYGGFDIYSVSLDSPTVEVCNLKMPYNSFADDFCLVLSPDGNGGFLVSTRDTSILDDKIYSFSAVPNFTFRNGFVYDKGGRPVENANITIVDKENDKILHMTKSGENGRFGFFINNARSYRLEVEKENCFPLKIEPNVSKNSTGALYNPSIRENITMDGFELNREYKMCGVFHQAADVEVQENDMLSSLSAFVKDNTNLGLYIYIFCYISPDNDFNEILNKKRISSLLEYMRRHGIPASRIKYETYENMRPVNFSGFDTNIDKSYALYFVVCPQKARPLLPKTEDYKPF